MTTLFRVRTALTNFAGGPGLSTMYFLDVATAHDAVRELWLNLSSMMPDDVHVQVLGGADTISDTDGALTGSVPTAQPDAIIPTGSGQYAAPAGVLVQWSTGAIMDKHRVRGRTFVVPALSSIFTTAGQVDPVQIAQLQTPISAFITSQAASFVIWHRPFLGAPAVGTKPARPAHLGGHALVTGFGVSTKAVVLRSRRD